MVVVHVFPVKAGILSKVTPDGTEVTVEVPVVRDAMGKKLSVVPEASVRDEAVGRD